MNNRITFFTFLFVVSASGLSCGPEIDHPTIDEPGQALEQAIINGKACGAAEQTTSVAIIVDATIVFLGFPLPIRSVMCTGTLIAPDVVLTAAHCVNPTLLTGGLGQVKDPKYYISFTKDLSAMAMDPQMIMSGKIPDMPKDALKAGSHVANPGFSPSLLQNFQGGLTNLYDVALIFLEKEVSSPEPSVVITAAEAKQVKVGLDVLISGWGQTTSDKVAPKGTVGKKICALAKINEVGTHEMQIGSDQNSERKCHGDSGGPSFLTVQTTHLRKVRVAGITSHAYDKTDCLKGGVDTRVDAWLAWIDSEMKKGCTDKKRVWCKVPGIIPPSHYDPEPDLGVDTGPDASTDLAPGAGDGAAQEDTSEGCECTMSSGGSGAPRRAAPPLALMFLLISARLIRRRSGG